MTAPASSQPVQPPPSALDKAAQLALLLWTYQQATQSLRDNLTSFVTTLWRSLGYYGNAQMGQFTGSVVPVVAGAQQQMASLTAAMIAQQQALKLDTPFLPPPLDPARVSGAAVRNGADPAEVYGRPFHLVWRQLDELPKQPGSIDQAIQAGLDRATQTALTDLQLAKTHAAQQTLEQDPHVVGYRRMLEGAYSCGLCIVAATLRYHKRDLMPIHPACVLGGTLVSVPATDAGDSAERGPIQAATRRRYDGEGVVLRTASGNLLTVTPNHPVLTPRGWIPAGLLREGDEVVSSAGSDRVAGRVPHEHEVPTLVEDRFRALSVDGLVAVPLAAEDFHGDASNGEVGVVTADRLLRDGGQPALAQVRSELLLPWGVEPSVAFAGGGDLAALLLGVNPTPAGLMGGSGLGGALLGGHSLGAALTGLGAVADDVSCPFHSADQGAAIDLELAADLERGRAAEIAGDGLWRDRGAGPKFDAPAVEFGGEGRTLYADRGSSLLDRLTGQVEVDRLVFVGRIDLSAHVYNLQTAEGWYSANGIIVSNCDCAVEPIYGHEDVGKYVEPMARDENGNLTVIGDLGDVHQAIADRFGKSDTGARAIPDTVRTSGKYTGDPVMYRDALIVHHHGEIGPVLAVRGAGFVGPNDLTH